MRLLSPIFAFCRSAVGPNFILMDDSAGPHRAHLTDDFLETENRMMVLASQISRYEAYKVRLKRSGKAIGTSNLTQEHPGPENSVAV